MSVYMVKTLKFGETFQKYKCLFFIAFKFILFRYGLFMEFFLAL